MENNLQWQLWVGIGGILLGLLMAYLRSGSKKVLDLLWAVDRYDAKELARMVKGEFNATVKVEGEVSCPEPVYGPATGQACCWVNTQIEREMKRQRTVTKKDSKGKTYKTVEEYTEFVNMYSATQTATMQVTDDTGYILVDTKDSDIETVTLRYDTIIGREHWFAHLRQYSDTNTYRITETAFLPEGYTFVLGEAIEHPEGALLRKPERGYLDPKAKFFFVYRRNEEQVTKAARRARGLYMFFGLAFFLAGAGFLISYFGLY